MIFEKNKINFITYIIKMFSCLIIIVIILLYYHFKKNDRFYGLSYYNATHNPWYNDWYRPWKSSDCYGTGDYGRSTCI